MSLPFRSSDDMLSVSFNVSLRDMSEVSAATDVSSAAVAISLATDVASLIADVISLAASVGEARTTYLEPTNIKRGDP